MSVDVRRAERRLAALAASVTDTPELVVDARVLEANLARTALAARSAGIALRPHTKTHKLPEIARRQLEAGAAGIQVAKLGEAEVMADAGIDDILIGFPIVGATKLDRLVALARRATITVSLDSFEVAAGIARAAEREGLRVGLLIELDTGLRRVGVPPGPEAIALAQRIAELSGTELTGVLTHEGHAYTGAGSADELREITRDACLHAVDTAERLRKLGLAAPVVSVGSSGTFRHAIEVEGVTEVRPGTYVFNDRTQIALGAATLDDVAAVVVATVVSARGDGEVVIDAGSKALTSDPVLIASPPATFGLADAGAGEIVRLSEEHGIVRFTRGTTPRIGDRVSIVPNHICPAVNLFEEVAVARDGEIVDRWPVAARGKLR